MKKVWRRQPHVPSDFRSAVGMGGLRDGRKTSGATEEIMAVNISLLQRSHWCFLFFCEQRGAIGVEMLLHMQESPTSVGLNTSDTLHRP